MARNGLVELPSGYDRQKVREDEIRVRAYYKWEAAGKPEAGSLVFWLEAEREFLSPVATA